MKESIDKALDVLKKGGVILYPTDTVWGIGCDATNTEAVKKLYEIKRRVDAKAMLMLVGSEGQLQQYVTNIPEAAWMLIDVAIHPLTIIYDHPKNVAANLLASDGSAGFRITSEQFSKTLCLRLGRPIVSTSANISGEAAPQCFEKISPEIKENMDYIVDIRPKGKDVCAPSNIIKVSDSGVIRVIR